MPMSNRGGLSGWAATRVASSRNRSSSHRSDLVSIVCVLLTGWPQIAATLAVREEFAMTIAKTKKRTTPRRRKASKGSFRDLKSFGLWAGRADVADPIQFTKDVRSRMERGNDAR